MLSMAMNVDGDDGAGEWRVENGEWRMEAVEIIQCAHSIHCATLPNRARSLDLVIWSLDLVMWSLDLSIPLINL
jgi:hypothetical protein